MARTVTTGTLHSAVFTKPESVRQVTAACSTMGMCPHGVALANLLRGRPLQKGHHQKAHHKVHRGGLHAKPIRRERRVQSLTPESQRKKKAREKWLSRCPLPRHSLPLQLKDLVQRFTVIAQQVQLNKSWNLIHLATRLTPRDPIRKGRAGTLVRASYSAR